MPELRQASVDTTPAAAKSTISLRSVAAVLYCGGRVGVRDGRNESKALFCRNKAEGKCDTPNMPYEEQKLL